MGLCIAVKLDVNISAAPSAWGVSPDAIIVCSKGAETPIRSLIASRDSDTVSPLSHKGGSRRTRFLWGDQV